MSAFSTGNQSSSHSETTKSKPIRILYIEDNKGLARLFQRQMTRLDYLVDLAFKGEEGIDKITAALEAGEPYDVVAVDYFMPGLNGLEVINRLSSDPFAPPTIMLTGTGSEQTAVEALKAGAKDYLVKDVDNQYLDLLPTVIEQVLNQERLEAENKANVEALRQKTAELQLRNQELDAFAHTVAHDLKNPLAGILGFANLIQDMDSTFTDDERFDFINRIIKMSQQMREIIDSLLLLAKVGKEDVNCQPINMKALVDETLLELYHLIDHFHPTISQPEEWPTGVGYAPWVKEVWSNYISNAIKYGGSPAQIELGAAPTKNGLVRYWVKDHGPGIPPEKQSLLFDAFTRLDVSDLEGHGLGLSIVKRIIQRLDGRCGLETTTGGGCTFWFDLPAS